MYGAAPARAVGVPRLPRTGHVPRLPRTGHVARLPRTGDAPAPRAR